MRIHNPKKSRKSSVIAYKVMEEIAPGVVSSALAKDATTSRPFTFNTGQRYESTNAFNLNPIHDEADGFRGYRFLSWARFMRDHIALNRRDRKGNTRSRKFVVVKVQLHDVKIEGYELSPQPDIPTKTSMRSRIYVAKECEFSEIKD